MPAWFVVLRLRCPGPLNSCSLVRPLRALLCWCGVLGQFAPAHLVPALFVVLRLRCPGPLGSCSPVRPIGALLCWCGVPGHFAPVHQCARWVPCALCAVSWATWLLFTAVPARCVVSRVRCPGPPGFCSPVRPPGALLCWCGVLGHLAPVHRCARSLCCVVCAVTWATWLLFTAVRAPFLAMVVRCPGPLSSCSPVCWLCVLCCVCSVLGHLAPDHRCARLGRCASRAVLGPLGFCSPVCPPGVLCRMCGVLGHLAAVHRCARSVRCFAGALSLATSLLFTDVPARCVLLCVRWPGPLGSCSPVCALRPLICLCGVLGHLAPVHRCARSVCGVVCAVSWATWLLFTGVPALSVGSASAVSWATCLLFTVVPAWCVVLCVQCPGLIYTYGPPARPVG